MSASEVLHFKTNYPNSLLRRVTASGCASMCCCVMICLALGCKPSSNTSTDKNDPKTPPDVTTPSKPKQVDPPKTPDPAHQIVSSSLFNVDLDMFKDAVRRQVIFAPTAAFKRGKWSISKDHLKSPALQARLVEMIVAQKIIAHEAKSRNIVVTPAEIDAAVKKQWRFTRFEPQGVRMPDGVLLPLPMSRLKISLDDVRDVAKQRLLRDKLRDKLLTEFTPEHFWLAWSLEHSRVRALVVEIPNTPQSYELDTYVQRNAKAIEAHFKANQAKYQIPKLVHLTMLKSPAGKAKDKTWQATLNTAKAELKRGDKPAIVASRHKLKMLTSQTLLRAEDKKAFLSKKGDVGVTIDGARGSYTWMVETFSEPRSVTLTSSRRREIAAELMRQKSIVPSVRQKAIEAQKRLTVLQYADKKQAKPASVKNIRAQLEKQGLRVKDTGFFTNTPEGFIPKIGLAEPVVPALFKLTMAQPVLTTPILARQKVYMAALLEREYADRKTYEANKDTFIKKYLKDQKPHLMKRFLGFRRQHYNVRTNLNPLRAEYGAIRKR